MAVPKLRFKDENGADYPEWKVGRLKDYGKAIGGYGFPEKYQGIIDNKIPFFKVSDMNTVGNEITMNIANNTISTETAKEIKVKPFLKKAIVFAKVGAAVYLERKRKAEPPFLVDNNMMIYQSDSINFDYLYHWFSNQKISRYAQIGALPSYNAGDIHSVKISVPCLEEQQKIADFLTTFDKRITAQQNIIADMEETKKGLLQKIFSQEIRFKDDNGEDYPEWKRNRLKNIASRITRKNTTNETDLPLTISSIDGLVDQRTYFKKQVASKDMSGYYLLYNGEFAYNRSYSVGYDFGSIKRLDKYDKGALSTLYICFSLNDTCNSDFVTHFFDSGKWNRQVYKNCAEGARNHGLLNISADDFMSMDVNIPALGEQNKIASFLSAYDKKIEAEKKILADLQEMKKGLLQQMFV